MLRRGLRGALLLGLVALVGILGWATRQAFAIKDDLQQGQSLADLVQSDLTNGQVGAAEQQLPALGTVLRRAADRTDGPAWWVAERVPLLGRNFHAVREAASAGRLVGEQVLPPAVQALEAARRGHLLQAGRVNLAQVARIHVLTARASAAAGRAHALTHSPPSLLLAPVGRGVHRADLQLGRLSNSLRSADTALRLAPGMLGAKGTRHFFVAVQNNAESRATGGLVGAFAIATTRNGRIVLEHSGIDNELPHVRKPVASDPGAAQVWQRIGSTVAWYDANLTPHFPDAASNLAQLWERQSGQHVDGVIGLDPVVMSSLLAVTGPVRLRDGTAISAQNVVDFVCRDEYTRYSDVPTRKVLLSSLAADLFHRMLSGGDSVRTLHAFATAGASGHLFVWSAHPDEQRQLGVGLVGGALPRQDSPYLSVLTQNFGGNKLDFYLHRVVRVRRYDENFLEVSVTLRNEAPLGLPEYVTVRSDRPGQRVPYATANVGLAVYGAWSSEIGGITVDGQPKLAEFDHDHGSRLAVVTLELPRQRDLTVKILITEPAGQLTYRQQPLIRPDELHIQVPHQVLGR